MSTHYCKRRSKVKRMRSIGFRARMKTKSGREIINNKRRHGRAANAAAR
jgi:large subunit ribosomal protein L34